MQRIVVVGTSGSGKSTLAAALARRLDAEFVELDALFWLPGWEQATIEVFRERVSGAIQGERWVVGGNYSRARDLIWSAADTIIWLDYPFSLVFSRLFRRTVKRIRTQENLWGTDNYETWGKQFFSRDSLFVWVVKTHGRYRRLIDELLQQPEYAHLTLLRFKTPGETDAWLRGLSAPDASGVVQAGDDAPTE